MTKKKPTQEKISRMPMITQEEFEDYIALKKFPEKITTRLNHLVIKVNEIIERLNEEK